MAHVLTAGTEMASRHLDIAQTLPSRLLRFFQRYPPSVYQGRQVAPGPGPNKNALPVSEALLRVTPPATASTSDGVETPSTPSEAAIAAATPTTTSSTATDVDDRAPFNPFLPCKNYVTGKWRSPVFSLRRQSEICKLARAHGVEDWLPYSAKLSWLKDQRRIEQGSRVKGTGVGERVKGHIWERTMKGRLEKRRVAMEGMPLLIRQWKEKGHGRAWKKWPSGKAGK